MEEFDEIWLLHHTNVWNYQFRLLRLWILPVCLIFGGTIRDSILRSYLNFDGLV